MLGPTRRASALLALVVSFGSHAAQAQSFAERTTVVAEERLMAGIDDVDGLTLGLYGAGLRYRVAPTLEVQALALGLRSAGQAQRREPASGGAGGELSAWLSPWPRAQLRPYASAHLGLLLFPRQPFLPGGDIYEGIISFSLGAELMLTPRWVLGARVFAAHLSNGQGLGPHNPAYDGYGAGLHLGYALAPPVAVADPWVGANERDAASVGVIADAVVGKVDEARLSGGRARGFAPLVRHTLLMAEVEGGALVSEPYGGVGLGVIGHFGAATLAATGQVRRYVGLDTTVFACQLEGHATPEVSLVGLVQREDNEAFDENWRAGVGARLYPTPALALDVGMGFDGINQEREDHADPYFGVEWAALRTSRVQLSLFVERQISTLDVVGARLAFDAGSSPRDTARKSGFRPLR